VSRVQIFTFYSSFALSDFSISPFFIVILSTVVRSSLGKFQVGDQLDALDTRNLWLEAEVVDINPDIGQIYIHYTGWSQRWDIWISESSERIGPYRSHTTGPTGPRPPIVPTPPPLAPQFDLQPMRD
jgi:hypothetical protein